MGICFWSCNISIYSESTLCNYLNVKERLARNKLIIWNLSDCNCLTIATYNILVRKKALSQSVSQSAKQTSLAGRLSDCLQPKSTWARIQLKSLVSMITLSSEDNTKILPQEDWISKEIHTNINTTNTNATNDETNKNLNVDLLRDLSFR